MELILTPELLHFLNGQGYRYCFSRTTIEHTPRAIVNITLTPVRARPRTRKLPLKYDTFFALSREPAQMAKGIDDTLVVVNVEKETFLSYISGMLDGVDKLNC